MREHKINNLNNFIGGWYLSDTTICDRIIKFFNTSDEKKPGVMYSIDTHKLSINQNIKKSLDLNFEKADIELKSDYVNKNLQLCINEYVKKYPDVNSNYPWRITQTPVIQYYKPGDGFFAWHTERGNNLEPFSSRHLVFMTYLNDVDDGGETEFKYQNIKVKPEKGLTLIWPPDWTFTHRGITSLSQEKYIITGWFNYVSN